MSRITIEAKEVFIGFVPTGYYHTYLVYDANDVADSSDEVFRGGSSSAPYPFNTIIADDGLLSASRDERDGSNRGTVLVTSTGAGDKWSIVEQLKSGINAALGAYDNPKITPSEDVRNSNSVTATALHTIGLDIQNYLPSNVSTMNDIVGASNILDFARDLVGTSNDDTIVGWHQNDTLDGAGGSDHLYGDSGNDSLDGGNGADFLYGGLDADTLLGGNDADRLEGGDGNDSLNGDAGADSLYGGTGSDTLDGGTGTYVDYLYGGAGNDSIFGGAGSDVMFGDSNDDTLVGGADADAFDGGSGRDTASYENSAVGETIDLNLATAQSGGEAQGDVFVSIENLILSSYNDIAYGDANPNKIAGMTGNDSLYGGDGNDTLIGDKEDGTLTGNDTLYGGNGDDVLRGGAGSDAMYGGSGDDTISYLYSSTAVTVDLAAGTASGGDAAGDTFSSIEKIVGSSGNDTLNGSGTSTISGGAGNDTLSGGTLLLGGSGSDTYTIPASGLVTIDDVDGHIALAVPGGISSFSGTSTWAGQPISYWNLTGGTTQLGVQYDSTSNSIKLFLSVNGPVQIGEIINAGAMSTPTLSSGKLSIDYTYNGLIHYGDGESGTLLGGSGNDVIYGDNSGTDIDGGAGADAMYGGNNDDRYHVDNVGDAVYEGSAGGHDVVESSISYVLGTNFEDLTLTGSSTINGTGNGVDNVITGNIGNNVLVGGAGADSIDGGGGFDRVDYAGSASAIHIDLGTNINSGGDAAGDVLNNIQEVDGTAYNDTLTGGVDAIALFGMSGADYITGSASNDTIDGGIGNDTLLGGDGNDKILGGVGSDYVDGGNGNDTLSFETSSVGVSADVGANNFFGGDAAYDNVFNVENLIGSAYADYLGGSSVANLLDGAAGNDSLVGGDGNDTLYGGSNDDQLYGGNGNDFIIGGSGSDYVDGGAGIDTLSFQTSSAYVSGDLSLNSFFNGDAAYDNVTNVENLVGSAYGDYLGGNSIANLLDGGDGNDSIVGGSGNDTLVGGLGNDLLYGGDGDDSLVGGVGSDYIDGGNGNDTLSFETSTDWISGDLALNSWFNGDATYDNVLTNVENLIGSIFGDYLGGNSVANLLDGGEGNDSIVGGDGNDTLIGGEGDDNLSGGNNDDSIIGGWGSDYVDGGAGNDTLSFETSENWVSADLANNSYFNGEASFDNVTNVENLTGSGFDDYLYGDSTANILSGGIGDDHLEGRAGNDTVFGGAGNDILVFGTGSGVDRVMDFTGAGVSGGDIVQISSSIYATATIALSHVTYGGGEAVLDLGSGNSVHLVGVTGLTAGDFAIV